VRTPRAAAVLLAALIAAACGGTADSTATVPPSAAPTQQPATAVPSLGSPTACTLPAGAAAPVLDPSLMSLLPSTVSGIAVTQEPSSFGEAVTDPCFAANVDRAVFPIAVSGSDLASGVVAHLRPGVYSDAFYSDWRATYDDGACAQASGVAAQANQTLGGRTIYVTTCGGGLRIYHAYLADKGVLISLLSTGPKGLGEQLMAAIGG
jgi:hypothetical protein